MQVTLVSRWQLVLFIDSLSLSLSHASDIFGSDGHSAMADGTILSLVSCSIWRHVAKKYQGSQAVRQWAPGTESKAADRLPACRYYTHVELAGEAMMPHLHGFSRPAVTAFFSSMVACRRVLFVEILGIVGLMFVLSVCELPRRLPPPSADSEFLVFLHSPLSRMLDEVQSQ
jgi:hypothetical protein